MTLKMATYMQEAIASNLFAVVANLLASTLWQISLEIELFTWNI